MFYFAYKVSKNDQNQIHLFPSPHPPFCTVTNENKDCLCFFTMIVLFCNKCQNLGKHFNSIHPDLQKETIVTPVSDRTRTLGFRGCSANHHTNVTTDQ